MQKGDNGHSVYNEEREVEGVLVFEQLIIIILFGSALPSDLRQSFALGIYSPLSSF